MRFQFFIVALCLLVYKLQAQDAPNTGGGVLSANASKASQLTSMPVNYFTGMPNISLPLYSYQNANNGLSLNVSIDYSPGGIRVQEQPTSVGLGWSLSAAGAVTRTVRGMPDDIPTYGYLYASSIPTDFRTDAQKYYYDSLDSQPDVFSFGCPGAGGGKFYLGKNGQIILIPSSKMKIVPVYETSGSNGTLKSFRIVSENGVKYDFDIRELSTITSSQVQKGYLNKQYSSTWYLSRIISAFNTDTIKFTYAQNSGSSTILYPQTVFLYSNNTSSAITRPSGSNNYSYSNLQSIDFPDNTHVNFIYSRTKKNTETSYAIEKVKVSDTIFRYGYLLDYDTAYIGPDPQHPGHTKTWQTRLFLKSLTPFTPAEKQFGYSFEYNSPLLLPVGGFIDTIKNKRDHWGFYNAAFNDTVLIPQLPGYVQGALREPNNSADASSLSIIRLPQGGYIEYVYELNDRYPYSKHNHQLQIGAASSAQNTLYLNQVFNSKHRLTFLLDKSLTREGSPPISGSGNLLCYIKSSDGNTVYASHSFSLNDLYYQGLHNWEFNLANGTYRLDTELSSGSSISGSFPVNIAWENKIDTSATSISAGGIRVKRIRKWTNGDAPESSQNFNYVLENGKSSGFLGGTPNYDYPFRKWESAGPNDFRIANSEPLNTMEFVQGSPVGYSRVEVTNGLWDNLGKLVYEFTDLKDVNSNIYTANFPYSPPDIRSWGLGLAKRISVYDSTGNLVKRTINNYQVDTVEYNSSDFSSVTFGHSATIATTTPNQRIFIGQQYYPKGGRVSLLWAIDSIYQTNGTVNVSTQSYLYDANYNLIKTATNYDRTRGLNLEVRNYYPYNYTIGGAIGKLRDSGILTTAIATEKWITGDSNPRIISGSISSYKELGNGMIKPDTLFILETNKPVSQSTIGSFSGSILNRNYGYFKPQIQLVSYNSKGIPVETKDIVSGISSTVVLDYNSYYPVAKISNAINSDVAYTSFESDGSGNWTIASNNRDYSSSITGKKSYNLSNGNISKSSLNTSKNYLLTLWAKSGASVSVNGTALSNSISSHQNWNIYQLSLSSVSTVTISGSGLIDEVRLHPKESNMESHTYEPIVGAVSSVDANNGIIYSEYDRLNRLKLVRDMDKNIIKRLDYSDTTMPVSLTPSWVGVGSQCSGYANRDTLYQDMNPFSDSSGYVKAVFLRFDCSCPEAINNPQYKTVNEVCEEGRWAVAASVYKKVLVDGLLQWRWVCTWRYCFSDGSQSTYYSETIGMNPCSLNCMPD